MMSCQHCGSEIVGRRSDATYCSNVCGNRARNQRYAKRNPEKTKAQRRYQNTKVENRIYTRIKSKAKLNNIPFDLEVCDIVVPTHCPILGIKLKLTNQGRGYHTDSPSLDRVDPTKGYIKGNVRVISARANLLKNDATAEELRLVLKDLERIEDATCV